jgi:hypothetical protein
VDGFSSQFYAQKEIVPINGSPEANYHNLNYNYFPNPSMFSFYQILNGEEHYQNQAIS